MRLQTLGGLALEGSDFRRPKALLLLAYLALEGPKERQHVAELFWPRAVRGRTDLSTTLTRLRKGAPGAVGADAARVWCAVGADVLELLELLEREAWEGALGLYRGRFLDGFDSRGLGAELEEWVYGTREVLAGRVQDAWLRLAEMSAAEGRFGAAAQAAEGAFALAPATLEPEALTRVHTLMLAGGSRRTAEVAEELTGLGLSPSLSAEDARERLLELLGGLKRTPHNLPLRDTTFVGRDLELAEVDRLLEEHRLVTLLGQGGVGKSRLALQAAGQQRSRPRFRDGVYFVALGALTEPSSIPTGIAAALSLELQGAEGPLEQVVRRIGERDVLLVLDNFEHLISGAEVVPTLLERCPNLALLVTSRERLSLEGEWAYEVEGLAVPAVEEDDVVAFDAVRLFIERARQVRHAFTGQPMQAVVTITRLVGGLPLAIELAAVWVRAMPPEEIARELAQSLDLLVTTTRNVPDKHRSIRASFDHSWRLLNARERRVFARLSTFRGGFRREAASEVAGATLPVLASLVDKSMLRLAPGGRYARHPLLYAYAREKLAEDPLERARAEEAHGVYHLRRLARYGDDWLAARVHDPVTPVAEELENVRLAWSWAVARGRSELLEGAAFALALYFFAACRRREGQAMFDEAIERLSGGADAGGDAALGACLCGWAFVSYHIHDRGEVRRRAEEGLRLLEPAGENLGMIALGREAIAGVLWFSEDYAELERFAESNLARARVSGDPFALGQALKYLGVAHALLDRPAEAKRLWEEALAVERRQGYLYMQPGTIEFLIKACRELGLFGEARRLGEEGLPLARAQNNLMAHIEILWDLGDVAFDQGRLEEARSWYQQAWGVMEERGAYLYEARLLARLGRLAEALGREDEARAYRRRRLEAVARERRPADR